MVRIVIIEPSWFIYRRIASLSCGLSNHWSKFMLKRLQTIWWLFWGSCMSHRRLWSVYHTSCRCDTFGSTCMCQERTSHWRGRSCRNRAHAHLWFWQLRCTTFHTCCITNLFTGHLSFFFPFGHQKRFLLELIVAFLLWIFRVDIDLLTDSLAISTLLDNPL